jgi:cytochrome b
MSAPSRFQGFLRVTTAVQAAAVLLQAVTAGMLLSGGGRAAHAFFTYAVLAAIVLNLVAAVRAGRSFRDFAPALAMLVLAAVQIVVGIMKIRGVHVPLGVLLFGGAMLQLAQAWPSRDVSPA